MPTPPVRDDPGALAAGMVAAATLSALILRPRRCTVAAVGAVAVAVILEVRAQVWKPSSVEALGSTLIDATGLGDKVRFVASAPGDGNAQHGVNPEIHAGTWDPVVPDRSPLYYWPPDASMGEGTGINQGGDGGR